MTKKDEEVLPEKEVYRLWWEYLKRSDSYKAYCESEFPVRIVQSKRRKPVKNITYKIYTKVLVKNEEKIISETVPQNEFLLFWNMERNWDTFGNIFKTSFDDWWKKKKIPNKELPVLALNDPDICTQLPMFVEENNKIKRSKAKYPNPTQILEQLTKSEPNYIFLAVPMVGNVAIEEISKQIASFRMKYKKEPLYRLADYMFKRFKRPISRVRFDEMKRYLRVYDLKQAGHTIKEIIAEIDPNRKGFDANIVRSFRSDLQKARKLIDNVEHGFFPEEPNIVTEEYLALLQQGQSGVEATQKKSRKKETNR